MNHGHFPTETGNSLFSCFEERSCTPERVEEPDAACSITSTSPDLDFYSSSSSDTLHSGGLHETASSMTGPAPGPTALPSVYGAALLFTGETLEELRAAIQHSDCVIVETNQVPGGTLVIRRDTTVIVPEQHRSRPMVSHDELLPYLEGNADELRAFLNRKFDYVGNPISTQ